MFITNNRASFHFWWKENLAKYQILYSWLQHTQHWGNQQSEFPVNDKVIFMPLKENLLKMGGNPYYRRYTLRLVSAVFKWSTSFPCYKFQGFKLWNILLWNQLHGIHPFQKKRNDNSGLAGFWRDYKILKKNMKIRNKRCVIQKYLSVIAPGLLQREYIVKS